MNFDNKGLMCFCSSTAKGWITLGNSIRILISNILRPIYCSKLNTGLQDKGFKSNLITWVFVLAACIQQLSDLQVPTSPMVGLGLHLVMFVMLHEGVSVMHFHTFVLFYFITTSLTVQPMWQESEEGIPHGIHTLRETLKTPELLEILEICNGYLFLGQLFFR